MGSREIALLAIAATIVAIIIAASVTSGRADVQIALINSSTQFMGTLKHVAGQYIAFNTTQDLQNISMSEVKAKGLLKSYTLNGSGSSSYIEASFDKKIRFSMQDADGDGNAVLITMDASHKWSDATDLQNWENSMSANISKSGGTVSNYESNGADGIISARFETLE
jgi:hypothetical protein